MPAVQPKVYRALWNLVHRLPTRSDEPVVIYPAQWLAEAWSDPFPPGPWARAATTRALWMLLADWVALVEPGPAVLIHLDLGQGGEPLELVRFRDALGALRRTQPQVAEVALFRAFGRMHIHEIGLATGVSDHVVAARWEYARLPLRREAVARPRAAEMAATR